MDSEGKNIIIISDPLQLEAIVTKAIDNYFSTRQMPGHAPTEILSPDQLCERLGISIPTQIRYRKKGLLPYIQIGDLIRYDLHKVLKALEKNKK